MGEVKHTPGPWAVRFARNGYPYSIEAPNSNRGPGGITSVTRWGAISFPSSAEGLANARLIAASPELLEAAQLVRMSFGWQVLSDETKAVVEAAIARATQSPATEGGK